MDGRIDKTELINRVAGRVGKESDLVGEVVEATLGEIYETILPSPIGVTSSHLESIISTSWSRKDKLGTVKLRSGAGMRLCLMSGGTCLW
jgi:hypothetical protein